MSAFWDGLQSAPCYPAAMIPPRNRWRLERGAHAPDAPRRQVDEGADALPVRIVIEQNGFVAGWDEGALGFDEEAVWFSGECTSFRIVAPDLAGAWNRWEIVAEGIVIRHPNRLVRLRVVFLAPPYEHGLMGERLAHAIARLRSAAQGWKGEARSEYPPLVPRPGAAVWRSRTNLLAPPGSTGPFSSWLERTGLTRLLASDLDFIGEGRRRARLLREIEWEEAKEPLSPPGERGRGKGAEGWRRPL